MVNSRFSNFEFYLSSNKKNFATSTETVFCHHGKKKTAARQVNINKVIYTKLSLNQVNLFSVISMTNSNRKSLLSGGNEASREHVAGGSVP